MEVNKEENNKKIKSQISRGGAPKKEEENKLKHRFSVQFSPKEKELLTKKLTKHGYKNLNSMVRDWVILDKIKVETTGILSPDLSIKFNSIGNLLNQIARYMNSNVYIDHEFLVQEMGRIEKTQEEIRQLILKIATE